MFGMPLSSLMLVQLLQFLCARSTCPDTTMAEPAQKKARTTRTFLFSSESVNEGAGLSREGPQGVLY